MSSSDSTLGASSKRPVLYWWLTLLVVLQQGGCCNYACALTGTESYSIIRGGGG